MKIITLCCNRCQNYHSFEAGSFEDMRGNVCDDCIAEEQEQAECSHPKFRCEESYGYEYYRCTDCGLVEAA